MTVEIERWNEGNLNERLSIKIFDVEIVTVIQWRQVEEHILPLWYSWPKYDVGIHPNIVEAAERIASHIRFSMLFEEMVRKGYWTFGDNHPDFDWLKLLENPKEKF